MSGNTAHIRENATLVSEYLREHGWCQLRTQTEDGKVCLLGALLFSEIPNVVGMVGALQKTLRDMGEHSLCLSTWNDMPGRTVEDVYELLDRVGR